MGYSSQTISGFNGTPPSNDGSQTTANQLDWDKHIDEIGTPLKNLAEGINSAMVSFAATRFGNSVTTFTTTITFDGNDEGSVQVFTGSSNTTATLPAAGTVGSDWTFGVSNEGSATLTIDGDGSETISGATTKTLEPGQSVILVSDGTNWRLIGVDPSQVNPTGMISPFMLSAAPAGWVGLARGTIGDTGSGADDASADNLSLFASLHGSLSETQAPVIEASAGWQTVSSVSAANDTITITSHGLLSNAKVVLLDGGSATAPTGLLFNQVYYVVSDTADTFKLSASAGPGAAINITGSGSGTLKIAELSKGTASTDFSGGKLLIVPDWRGRTVTGSGTGEDGTGVASLTARTIGDRDGAETHTLTVAQTPSHSHFVAGTTSGNGTALSSSNYLAWDDTSFGTVKNYELSGRATVPSIGLTSSSGSGSAHNIMQPWAAALWCIKK